MGDLEMVDESSRMGGCAGMVQLLGINWMELRE